MIQIILRLQMPFNKNSLAIIGLTAGAYYLLFELNRVLFSSIEFAPGVNWIYLPSGLRLAFVLIFVNLGAVGIVLASLSINMVHHSSMGTVTLLVASFISGFAPWLARIVCINKFKFDTNLHQLSTVTLIKIAMVFSVASALMHQIWFTWQDPTNNFFSATAVMALGDFFGTLIVLYATKTLANLVLAPQKIQ